MSDPIRNQLSVFRQQQGLRQQDLAQAVGVTRQTIISIERGNYAPSVGLALRLARYFEVAVEDIFSLYDQKIHQ